MDLSENVEGELLGVSEDSTTPWTLHSYTAVGDPLGRGQTTTQERKRWSPRAILNALTAALAWLPEGRLLPERTWQRRHHYIVTFALLQAVAVGVFGLLRREALTLCLLYTVVVGTPALLSAYAGASRRSRTISSTVSLMFASVAIVDFANGNDVAHFHFFVMVGVVALYQDWTAFGVCILITVLHHAVIGSVDPSIVYGDAAERSKPILWAFVHGTFILAASLTHLIAWRANEQQELSDTLTGLPNRTAFVERLERSLSEPAVLLSVLFIDLDNFKTINDAVGHHAGDEALRFVAACFDEVLRPGELAARLGGDEFAILINGGASMAKDSATRVLKLFEVPHLFEDREIVVRASIGIVDSELARSRNAGDLLRDADLAMYLAKSSGGNRTVVYTPGVDQMVRYQAELATDLRSALDAGELDIEYQPVVTGVNGALEGVEALLRWNHPKRGLISPAEFIHIAESTGEIRRIGAWVLRASAERVVSWQQTLPGCSEITLAVNLSAVQLRGGDLLDIVRSVLHDTGLRPASLTLEVTESILLDDVTEIRAQLSALRSLGVRIAIDDFGTGYSSLSYLSTFPADIIKIDRSFVVGLDSHTGASVLVQAVVDMANALDLDIIAEGVEAQEQQAALDELGCELSQGYLFSAPLSAARFPEVVKDWPKASNASPTNVTAHAAEVGTPKRRSAASEHRTRFERPGAEAPAGEI